MTPEELDKKLKANAHKITREAWEESKRKFKEEYAKNYFNSQEYKDDNDRVNKTIFGLTMKKEYKVYNLSLEISIEATSHFDAASTLASWLRSDTNWAINVQEENDDKVYIVDLAVDDEDAVIELSKYKPIIREKSNG